MTVEWRKIPSVAHHYEVSSDGRVRRLDRKVRSIEKHGEYVTRTVPGRELEPRIRDYGKSAGRHPVVPIINEKKKCHSVRVCILVARAFHGCPYPPGDRVARQNWRVLHRDGNTLNNAADNLGWIGGNTDEDCRTQYERNLVRLAELRQEPVEEWVRRMWGEDAELGEIA